MKRAIDVGLFGELADPRVAVRLAARAEERGWDGLFTIGLPGPKALAELAAEIRDAPPAAAPST